MRLRHRIYVQKNTPTTNTAGEPIESWATYMHVPANVEDIYDNRRESGPDPREAHVTVKATIRFPRAGRIPQPTDRYKYTEGDVTRTIHVDSVIRDDKERRYLTLYGTEVQG